VLKHILILSLRKFKTFFEQLKRIILGQNGRPTCLKAVMLKFIIIRHFELAKVHQQ